MKYLYKCHSCGREIEVTMTLRELEKEPFFTCPSCGQQLTRVISKNVGFIGPKQKGHW